MVEKILKYRRIAAGMIALNIFLNSATAQVYASEGLIQIPDILKNCNVKILQDTSEQNSAEELDAVIEIKEEDIDTYFASSVFVGDSIMLGFRNYSMKQKESFLNNIQFLAAGSFSASNALWEVTKKSVHPVYKGQKRHIWESISMMDVDKAFICLGMNDLNVYGLEGTIENYKKLIANIKEKNPELEIHIISMTYTLKDTGKGKLKNDIIREFNVLLQDMSKENGWGYLDLATPLSDENGDLLPAYCSDGFVHQSRAAYDVWTTEIRNYAKTQIDGTAKFPYVNTVQEEIEKEKIQKESDEEASEIEASEIEASEKEASFGQNKTVL